MEKEDVIKLFKAWRSAGLRPPVKENQPEMGQQMIDAFYGQYKNLTAAEVQMLSEYLSRLEWWPRFYDVDNALAEMHRADRGSKANKRLTAEEAKAARDNYVKAVLKGTPRPSETWVKAMAKKFAKQNYPECTEQFIADNELSMAAQMERDYECAMCNGKNANECPTGGHRPFLRIDKYTGLCVQHVDYDQCPKLLVSLRSQERKGIARGGGFTAVGEVSGSW